MRVRRHAPTGVTPNWRFSCAYGGMVQQGKHLNGGFHVCTEACSDWGITETEVSYVYGGMPRQGLHLNEGLMRVRRHSPTRVALKRRFSCLYGSMLQQG